MLFLTILYFFFEEVKFQTHFQIGKHYQFSGNMVQFREHLKFFERRYDLEKSRTMNRSFASITSGSV